MILSNTQKRVDSKRTIETDKKTTWKYLSSSSKLSLEKMKNPPPGSFLPKLPKSSPESERILPFSSGYFPFSFSSAMPSEKSLSKLSSLDNSLSSTAKNPLQLENSPSLVLLLQKSPRKNISLLSKTQQKLPTPLSPATHNALFLF